MNKKDFNPFVFLRYKNDFPFSQKLNNFIIGWFESKKDTFIFTDKDDFDDKDIKATFEAHKKIYRETGKIYIWKGESENTIFGKNEVNFMFRAWHDWVHLNYNLGYSITDESIVCDIQKDMLPYDWYFEKTLLDCEIKAQAYYFYKNNKFVNNQRNFTILWLESSINALNNKTI